MPRPAAVYLAAAAIIIAPLSMLLIYPHSTFNIDWQNNLWMVEYTRQYLADHLSLPIVYNVADHVGIPQPVFYGPVLYPILAIFSRPLGAAVGIRIACFALWGLQFYLLYRLCRAVGAGRLSALGVCAIVSSSVYALTNLYNRGALAEFFATGFLLCAILAGGLGLLLHERRSKIAFALLGAVCAALAMASHAPTALVGGATLVLFSLPALRLGGGDARVRLPRRIGVTAAAIVFVALVLAPWLYVVAQFAGQLSNQVPNEFYRVAGHWQRFAQIDSVWARLQPLPIFKDWKGNNADRSRTVYLDAQWNFPLVVLAVWSAGLVLAGRCDARAARAAIPLMWTAAAAGAALLIISISPTLQDALPRRFGPAIQFPYRLVSHVNNAALVVLLAAWIARGTAPLSSRLAKADRIVMAAVVLLAAVSLGIKLGHAATTQSPQDDMTAADYLQKLPHTFGGQDDYTVQVPWQLAPPSARTSGAKLDLPAGLGPRMGVQQGSILFDKPQWAITSVLNFPWNRLILDGKPIPFDQVHNLFFHQAVYVDAGLHSFGYRLEPDSTWETLSTVSWIVLACGVAATFLAFLRTCRGQRLG